MMKSRKKAIIVMGLAFTCIMIVALINISTLQVKAQSESGRKPENSPPVQVLGPLVNINPVIRETGNITLSVDGLGTFSSTGTIDVQKPAGATVRGAFMAAASTGLSGRVLVNGDVKINGTDIVWSTVIPSSINSTNSFGDVTSIIKPIIDAAPAGLISVTITEVNSSGIDGEILAVIFDDPNQTTLNTIIILFGAQNVNGDTFNVTTEDPIDPSKQIDMSLGISFGFQGSVQFSTVDVNGTRLTSSAGGQDDGTANDGALLTVGGIGDVNTNPPPFAGPNNNPRIDDEFYDLRPFVTLGATNITIFTQNPSDDDNIFFGAFFFKDARASIGCTITCPADVTQPNTPGQCGAIVNYPAPAASNCGSVNCTPSSGTSFPVGTTTVTCTGTNPNPLPVTEPFSCSFTVTITDTEAPAIVCPNSISIQCVDSPGTKYTPPSVTDNCPNVTITCSPPPDFNFRPGSTVVNCEASDQAGNTSRCTFQVTVADTTPPTITDVPTPGSINTNGACTGAIPDLRATVKANSTDNCTPQAQLTVIQSPAAGTPEIAGIGTTAIDYPVTITVTDAAGNQNSRSVLIRILGGGPASITISPNPLELGSVKLFGAAKKKKKVKPTAVTGSFIIKNDGCAPITVTPASLTRLIGGSDKNESNDFLTITVSNPNTPLGPGDMKTVTVRFNPTVPGISSCASSSQIPGCLRASDVVPNNFQSTLSFSGTDKKVTISAKVDKGVKLIDPANPSGAGSLVTLCRSGDEFTITYFIYDPDLSDVRTAKYEFLDSNDKVIKAIDNVDLAGPIGKSGLVNGMSFKVQHVFSGVNDNSDVVKVRVTINSTISATSSGGTSCGAGIQSFHESQGFTVLLPARRLDDSQP